MENSLYTLDDKKASIISLKDLARRSRYGGVFYLLAFWAIVFSSGPARQYIDVIVVFSLCFLLLQLYRTVLFFKITSSNEIDTALYYRGFSILYNVSAICWVSGSAWLYSVNPAIDIAILVSFMATAGISIGGVTVLATSYKILRSYCVLISLPFISAAAIFLDKPDNGIIVCLAIIYALFVFIVGKQQNRAYWQALNDNLMLAAQANELEKAKKEAELAGQAKADFLAAMTHEIRTPMNGILGMTQMLTMEDLNKHQQQQVAVINSAGRTLMHIINNILDYSKINANKLAIEQQPFQPKSVIEEVTQLFVPQAKEKSINLTCSIENIPETVLGDAYRLHQILYNLLGNAFKFTHSGEISIKLSSEEENEDTCVVFFAVQDTGIGIEIHDQQRIFEQFNQVNPFDSNIRGTGLGLTITQHLVHLMNGTIKVESELGVGTLFTVSLPFSLPKVSGFDELALEQESAATHLARGVRVLLVEDNQTNQMICERFLAKLGSAVDIAETGVIALEKFNGHKKYDVIFMDCNMPDMDGFSATKRIRQLEKEKGLEAIPIIALTALVQDDIKQKCLQAGMNDFLSKPFLFEDLKAMINRVKSNL